MIIWYVQYFIFFINIESAINTLADCIQKPEMEINEEQYFSFHDYK